MEKKSQQFKSLKGRAWINVVSTRENLSSQCLVFLYKPDKFRLEILNAMKLPYFLFVTDGKEWCYYSSGEDRYHRGKNDEKPVLIGIKLEDVLAILSGEFFFQNSKFEMVNCISSSKYTLITFSKEDGRMTIWFDFEVEQIVKVEFNNLLDELKWRVNFKNFQKIEDFFIPQKIEIYLPKESTWIKINYEEMYINQLIDSQLFTPSFYPIQ